VGKLSAARVRNARPGKSGRAKLYGDGGGLWLQATAAKDGTVSKSWIFRFAVGGRRERKMGLGPLDTVSLAEARDKARLCRQQRLGGADPIAARDAQRAAAALAGTKAISFKECAAAYMAAHRPAWKNVVHSRQWERSIATYVNPVLGSLPVAAIDTAAVLRAIEPIWSKKTETASRVRGRIESVLDWAKVRGYRDGENPARWRGHLDHVLPARRKVQAVTHLAALPYAELPPFMAELRSQQGAAPRALEFAILTACRTGEVLGARWDEFNLAEKMWIIPAGRMKAGKEHRVPLSPRAIGIVAERQKLRTGDVVFAGRGDKGLSDAALRRVLAGRATAHGFRSTFRDWAAERTNFPREVVEMCLAHSLGNAVEAAYLRSDMIEKRRALMTAWEAFCGRPAGGATVTPIHKVRAHRG
jgi:integrase